jgi:hypothetical protein
VVEKELEPSSKTINTDEADWWLGDSLAMPDRTDEIEEALAKPTTSEAAAPTAPAAPAAAPEKAAEEAAPAEEEAAPAGPRKTMRFSIAVGGLTPAEDPADAPEPISEDAEDGSGGAVASADPNSGYTPSGPATPADEEIIGGFKMGCYLKYEFKGSGTLAYFWSEKRVSGALAYCKPSIKPAKFQFKNKKGRVELGDKVNGNIPKYCECWAEYLKVVQKYQGNVVMLASTEDEMEVAVLLQRRSEVRQLARGQWAHSKYGEMGEAVIVIAPSAAAAFELGPGALTEQGSLGLGGTVVDGGGTYVLLEAVAGGTQQGAGDEPTLFGALPLPPLPAEIATAAAAAAAEAAEVEAAAAVVEAEAVAEAAKEPEDPTCKVVEVNGAKVELRKGCYLMHEDINQGTFILKWSEEPLLGALAYFNPDSKAQLNKFLYTKNGGVSEFERGVNGNIHMKHHCRGWCQFFRLAREKYAQVVVLKCDGCALLYLRANNIEPVKAGVVYDTRDFGGADVIAAVPRDSECYTVNGFDRMERDTFIITAAQNKGHSMPFLLHASKRYSLQAGMSRKDRQAMEEANEKQAVLDEECRLKPGELGEGCYLTLEPQNQGTLVLTWSKAEVLGAIAYFKPKKEPADYKFNRAGGRSDFERQVNGNVHFKNLSRGWCLFWKVITAVLVCTLINHCYTVCTLINHCYTAPCLFWKLAAEQEAKLVVLELLTVAMYTNRATMVELVRTDYWYQTEELLHKGTLHSNNKKKKNKTNKNSNKNNNKVRCITTLCYCQHYCIFNAPLFDAGTALACVKADFTDFQVMKMPVNMFVNKASGAATGGSHFSF